MATLNPCQGENSALYTRSHEFGRRKKKKQNGGVAAAAPTDYSSTSGHVTSARSESNSYEPEHSRPPAIFDQSQIKTSKTQSQLSLDKLMEAIKPKNLLHHLLTNIQAVFDDTMFEEAQHFRTEMDKSLAEICSTNEKICNAITNGRGSLQIVVKEDLRGSLGHLTERLFTLGVAESRNVLMSEFSAISKGQTKDDSTIWMNLQQEYCKAKGGKFNNATCANVAKWVLEAKIAETNNEVDVGRGSKGKFWEKANRLNEVTVLFGRGILFALDKEVSGSVVEKLAMKEGVPGSLKSLDVSEHQSLKAFLNSIWTTLQGDTCLTQHSLQAVSKDGIEKVQQLLRHFPYSNFDTLSQYLSPEDRSPIESQELEFDAILRRKIGARKDTVPRDQESSHGRLSSLEVPPLNSAALISSGSPGKLHDVACEDGITDEGSPVSQYDAVMGDVLSPPTHLRGPISSSDASFPTAYHSDSTSASLPTLVNPRSSEMERSTLISSESPISSPPTKAQGSQQSDIRSQSEAERMYALHFAAAQDLCALFQQNSSSDISSRVQRRSLPPLGEEEQSSKRQRTNDDAADGGSPLFKSGSLPPRSSALTTNTARPKGWKKCCPLCRCNGLEVDEFKAHMKESHLLTDHGMEYDSVVQTVQASLSTYERENTPESDLQVWCTFSFLHLECPTCDFKNPTTPLMHPLEPILEPYDEGSEIYQHAEGIAVMWPAFATHPVFDLILARTDRKCSLS